MKYTCLALALICSLSSCAFKRHSDFEKMLSGFPSCEFENLYVDYATHVPQHQYFTDRNMMPNKVEKEAAFFNIDEKFHDIPVDEIVISAGFGIVIIRFDAPLGIVEEKMHGFLKYGYNKPPLPVGAEDAILTPLLKPDVVTPQKTNLICDFEPNY